MARMYLFGWRQGVKQETGKAYKLICLGEQSDEWHGFDMTVKYLDPDVQIPPCEPGTLVSIEFDKNGYIDKKYPIEIIKRNG